MKSIFAVYKVGKQNSLRISVSSFEKEGRRYHPAAQFLGLGFCLAFPQKAFVEQPTLHPGYISIPVTHSRCNCPMNSDSTEHPANRRSASSLYVHSLPVHSARWIFPETSSSPAFPACLFGSRSVSLLPLRPKPSPPWEAPNVSTAP